MSAYVETLELLLTYRDRLVGACGDIDTLRLQAPSLTELDRLASKLEGVRLALSYLDEVIGR